MAIFCLIHSSGQGPSGWRLLAQCLEDRGHHVLAPAFQVSETDKGSAWHAEALAEELRRSGYQPSEMVCVAHSRLECFFRRSLTSGRCDTWSS